MKSKALFIFALLAAAVGAGAKSPVRSLGAPAAPAGLDGINIAMWQSHGLYYNNTDKQAWIWQRAPLNQTIEDIYSASYVLDLLVPMLENAGAYVMLPRERDMSDVEVIIDADAPTTPGYTEHSGSATWSDAGKSGFAMPDGPLVGRENPFAAGKVRSVKSVAENQKESTAEWNASIPRGGLYNIYISYASLPQSSSEVIYTVSSLRGEEKFAVNQTMGGGTWIRLGEFPLAAGMAEKPIVTLSNHAKGANVGKMVTADAVRIGGGMGNVARGESPETARVSRRPRWLEGSRYWLQWAGAPDSVYASSTNNTDYADDFRSRPNWVNWLAGGSSRMPRQKGLGIPIDIAFALHTDAGTTPDSTIIGTLGIYSTDGGRRLGDGRRRTLCRDLATAIVDQVVADIKALHEPIWTKRKMRDRKYAEARIPDVPVMLLELLSHQNFADMRHGLNPQFRFDVSRAIYKGMLKYLAGKQLYVVQPLPVNSFIIASDGDGSYTLSWQPTDDPLEPSATPDSYDVEIRRGVDGVFVPYKSTKTPSIRFKAEKEGEIYSFRVMARNRGGKSFPSETLSLCHIDGWKPEVLVVNGFTRVSAPDWIETPEKAGFLDRLDHGVPYIRNIGYTGSQYNFDRASEWVDDIVNPGWGASDTAYIGRPVAGNSFDFPSVHGKAIAAAGHPFVSASVKGWIDNPGRFGQSIVDLILGKQKEIQPGVSDTITLFRAFTPELQQRLESHLDKGGSLLVSGAFVGSDLMANQFANDSTLEANTRFAERVLGISHQSSHAGVTGKVDILPAWTNHGRGRSARFQNEPDEKIYVAESVDAIEPAEETSAETILGYDRGVKSAAVAWNRRPGYVVTMGLPFETLVDPALRNDLMAQLLLRLQTVRQPIVPPADRALPRITPSDIFPLTVPHPF